jgi:hypothetical protein
VSILRAGYHDIVSVFLLVCGEHQAYYLVERLSLLHIRSVVRQLHLSSLAL